MTYKDEVIPILNELVARLKEISILENRVYKGFYTVHDVYPVALIHLVEDNPLEQAIRKRRHVLTFNVLLKVRGDPKADSETQMTSFIEQTGYVADKFDEYISNPPYWEKLSIDRISFTFGQERQVIFYNALFTVRIFKVF